MQTIRAFVAIELAQAAVAALRQLQNRLRNYPLRLRWVAPEKMHLTVKFLGDVPEAQIESLAEAMRAAARGIAPLSLNVRGLGVFPNLQRARVLWAGVDGEIDALRRLQQQVESQFEAMGYPREKRPFQGHLTLGRAKGRLDAGVLSRVLADCGGFATAPFTAGRMVMFRSELSPQGARYTALHAALLEG
jgi:2'-5' RNA ligase